MSKRSRAEKIRRDRERDMILQNAKTNPLGLVKEDLFNRCDDRRFIQLQSSISHTYGNALGFIQGLVLDLFPENTFKTIHVNSTIAHRQIRSTHQEYLKKSKPMIIFRPRIGTRDDDKFLKGTELIERQDGKYRTWGGTNLQNFFHDPDHDLVIKYKLNRVVMNVDVICIFSTLIQQLDYYHYLDNRIQFDNPYQLETCFENYIPQEMLKVLSDNAGIPLYDDNGNTKEFVEYMNGHSQYPITYKLQGSTRSREFYRYYPLRVDTTFSDLDKDEGDRAGNVMDAYRLNFTVRMEFNTAGFYYLFGENLYDLKIPPKEYNDDSTCSIIYTDVLLPEDLQLQHGWILYNRASYKMDGDNPNEIVDMKQLLNNSIMAAIKYHRDNGLPLFDLIDLKVRRQGKLINQGTDYLMDWDRLKFQFINQNTNFTYSFTINVNQEYINDLIKKVYDLK
jgi:hypothetical protein